MDVTCAILIHNKTVLLARRAQGSDRAGLWEFPGGKLHKDETLHNCIKREIFEELNVTIKIISDGPVVKHSYPDKTIKLFPFICSISEGVPKPIVHAELKWTPFEQLTVMDLCQADKLIAQWFISNLNLLSL